VDNSLGQGSSSGTLLLFGATGDLAKRMLLPSLFTLFEDGLINRNLHIVGTARSDFDDQKFRDLVGEALDRHLPDDRKRQSKIVEFASQLSAARPL